MTTHTSSDETTEEKCPAVDSAELSTSSSGTKLRDQALEQENFDLIAKVVWLIESGPGWSEDGTFTFPDGETWARFDPEGGSND